MTAIIVSRRQHGLHFSVKTSRSCPSLDCQPADAQHTIRLQGNIPVRQSPGQSATLKRKGQVSVGHAFQSGKQPILAGKLRQQAHGCTIACAQCKQMWPSCFSFGQVSMCGVSNQHLARLTSSRHCSVTDAIHHSLSFVPDASSACR